MFSCDEFCRWITVCYVAEVGGERGEGGCGVVWCDCLSCCGLFGFGVVGRRRCVVGCVSFIVNALAVVSCTNSTCHVYDGSEKNDTCNRTSITPKIIYLHYGLLICAKNSSVSKINKNDYCVFIISKTMNLHHVKSVITSAGMVWCKRHKNSVDSPLLGVRTKRLTCGEKSDAALA